MQLIWSQFFLFSTKGHGEMQEQKLNNGSPDAIALQLYSSLYHTRPCSPSLYLLISEVILVCQLFYQFQWVSQPARQSVSWSVSVQVSSCHIQKREAMNMYLSYNIVFLLYLLFFFLGTKCKGTLLLMKGPFCILSTKSCLIILPWCVNGTNNCCKLLKKCIVWAYLSFFLSILAIS
jgi:hypothetical protein